MRQLLAEVRQLPGVRELDVAPSKHEVRGFTIPPVTKSAVEAAASEHNFNLRLDPVSNGHNFILRHTLPAGSKNRPMRVAIYVDVGQPEGTHLLDLSGNPTNLQSFQRKAVVNLVKTILERSKK